MFCSNQTLLCFVQIRHSSVLFKSDTPLFCSNQTLLCFVQIRHSSVLFKSDTPLFYSNQTLLCFVQIRHSSVLFKSDTPLFYSNQTLLCFVQIRHSYVLFKSDTPLFCSNQTLLCFIQIRHSSVLFKSDTPLFQKFRLTCGFILFFRSLCFPLAFCCKSSSNLGLCLDFASSVCKAWENLLGSSSENKFTIFNLLTLCMLMGSSYSFDKIHCRAREIFNSHSV